MGDIRSMHEGYDKRAQNFAWKASKEEITQLRKYSWEDNIKLDV
jgi:hypothetical protein